MVEDGREWAEPQGYTLRDINVVRHLWDHARTARMSELYYGQRLAWYSMVDFWIGLLIAIFSSGSGIAGWALWTKHIGKEVWAAVAGVTAVLGIVRPLLHLDRTVEQTTRQQGLYRTLLGDIENLIYDIQYAGSLSAEHHRRYLRVLDIMRQATDADVTNPSVKRLRKLQSRVNEEMPAEQLWIPEISPKLAPA